MIDIVFHQKVFYTFLLFLNSVAFSICGWDKYHAKHRKRRIPERTLFLLATLGGSIGLWCGMYFFRHKTKHQSFVWGIPFILLLQLFILCIFHAQF